MLDPNPVKTKRRPRGLWAKAGIPHKGWTRVGEDENEDLQLCQMCKSSQIRYIHIMTHPDHPEQLAVGCVCAEHMSQAYCE